MKLTGTLQHAKYFWWGKGWGSKPRQNTDSHNFRVQWNSKRRRQVEVISQKLPEGVQPIDPNVYVAETIKEQYSHAPKEFILPWPYSKRPVKGL